MNRQPERAEEDNSNLRQRVEDLEIDLLMEAVYRHYGYDFRDYARASLRRRLANILRSEQVPSVSVLQDRVLRDPAAMARLLRELTVNVTALFRDPGFFRAFREYVVPLLRTYPFLRFWHAGCATGEEVYSLAIILQEEGLIDRSRIYATDMDEGALKEAREGIFRHNQAALYASNYREAGGANSLDDYFTSAYGNCIFNSSLKENMVFSPHNLAVDGSFNEFHVILCRNVMIYFGKSLQERVHRLLYDSLSMFGILGLGAKESIAFTPHENQYERLAPGLKLFRRIS